MLLGFLGLASSLFVVVRLVETWRVTAETTSHQISLLGLRLSYPTVNFAAGAVLVLALLGLAATAMAIVGAAREFCAARRFARLVASWQPQRLGDALVIPAERPFAFCAGLLRPRVYVSSGAVGRLDEASLQAVLMHERHHAQRRDPLRLAFSRVIVRALFFLPWLREMMRLQQSLAELSADESAVSDRPENRAALARAMLKFSDGPSSGELVGIDPVRVDFLLGETSSWRFPLMLSLAAIALIGLIVATAVLAGQFASGEATLAPPFFSSQPCVIILAVIPALLGLVALRLRRAARAS
jgi:Zn-dependent protease with chaperone function